MPEGPVGCSGHRQQQLGNADAGRISVGQHKDHNTNEGHGHHHHRTPPDQQLGVNKIKSKHAFKRRSKPSSKTIKQLSYA
jgi:hypothetical protein